MSNKNEVLSNSVIHNNELTFNNLLNYFRNYHSIYILNYYLISIHLTPDTLGLNTVPRKPVH